MKTKIFKTVILTVIFYARETLMWGSLRAMKIFGTKKVELHEVP
jgi:hypothetical protein